MQLEVIIARVCIPTSDLNFEDSRGLAVAQNNSPGKSSNTLHSVTLALSAAFLWSCCTLGLVLICWDQLFWNRCQVIATNF
jgi:hypothetical protein